jgi:pterin-4a-carbinolamine dehydratase
MAASIFISYRRDDSAAEAGALCKALRQKIGANLVFMDTSSIEPGSKWPGAIEHALKSANTVVVVIGPEWVRSADEWGQRRIDQEDDWVKQEVALALKDNKTIIPILVRDARIPPPDVLPEGLKELPERQVIELRRDYWDHDIKLLLAPFHKKGTGETDSSKQRGPYPIDPPMGPDPVSKDKLEIILKSDLAGRWKKVVSPLPEDISMVREELFREYTFKSFQDAIHFMYQVAPGCDIADHHPRWENLWQTLRVYLTTWDIEHRISDRDVQLARYFDRAYSEFPGAAKRQRKNED